MFGFLVVVLQIFSRWRYVTFSFMESHDQRSTVNSYKTCINCVRILTVVRINLIGSCMRTQSALSSFGQP